MAADLNKPVNSDLYTQILADIRDMQAALAKMNHAATANLPAGVIQWSDANGRFEKWSGTAWVALLPDASTITKGLAQLSTNSNSTSSTLAATPSAVKAVRDLVTALTFASIGGAASAEQVPSLQSLNGACTASQVPALSGMIGSLTDAQLKRPSILSGHVRAGNAQIPKNSTAASFNFITNVPDMTWTSIGPTGSGATVIWTALDALPASASVLIIDIETYASLADGDPVSVFISFAAGDIVSPSHDAPANRIVERARGGSTLTTYHQTKQQMTIPLSPGNTFKARSQRSGVNAIVMYYQGFMSDS